MSDSTGETFGRAVRRLRDREGWSQSQLARRVPTTQASVSRYEHDSQHPSMEAAARLDELLNAGGYLVRLAAGDASDVLSTEDVERIARAIERPRRLDAGVVAAFTDVLASQRRLDDVLGPHLVLPSVLTQMNVVKTLVKQSTGPYRSRLAGVAAQWVQFAGWLHAEARNDTEALRLLAEAANAADEVDDAVLAAQASNFMGYVSRQQSKPRGVVRWFLSEHHTPGANLHQRIGSAAQAAHGLGVMGETGEARRLLDTAERMLEHADGVQAPATAYWLDANFHRLNLGLGFGAIGETEQAVEHLAGALNGLPVEQQGAEWTVEYRQALEGLS